MLNLLERTLLFSALLLTGLIVLLFSVFSGFGGRLPELRPLPRSSTNASLFPNRAFHELFATSAVPALAVPTNTINPFFTLYFAPPPPPPTKKVNLLYIGSIESSTRTRLAYLKLDDALLVLPAGAKVVADHAIKDIALGLVTLTNAAGQTNLAWFNTNKVLEVPAN